MATLKQIARHLGVSVTQVSRALNDHDDVSRATKERVWEAARELGYTPNLTARKLRSGRSGIVAMIVPARSETVEIELLMEAVMGLSAGFSRRDMQFVLRVLSDGEDAAEAHEKLLRGGSVDGVVVADPRVSDPRIAVLEASGTPFVVHGRDRLPAPYRFVDIDHREVGYRLAASLADRGCQRIALVDGPADRPYSVLRHDGFSAALTERGLTVDPALVVPGLMTEARGRDTGDALRAEGVDGVVAGNMMLAAGLRASLGPLPIAAHDDDLLRYGPDTVGAPLVRTLAPLSDAWPLLCDGLCAVIETRTATDGVVLGLNLISDP